MNAVGKRGSLNVRFAPIATELLRRREMSRRAKSGRRRTRSAQATDLAD
jgi:hypothetical protein